MFRAAVGQIIAGNAGDDHVLQAQRPRRFGHTARLVGVNRLRFSLFHATEPAAARADIAQDQERGGLLRVTFHPVRTFGMVADRLQAQLPDQLGREVVGVALRDVPLQPTREGMWGFWTLEFRRTIFSDCLVCNGHQGIALSDPHNTAAERLERKATIRSRTGKRLRPLHKRDRDWSEATAARVPTTSPKAANWITANAKSPTSIQRPIVHPSPHEEQREGRKNHPQYRRNDNLCAPEVRPNLYRRTGIKDKIHHNYAQHHRQGSPTVDGSQVFRCNTLRLIGMDSSSLQAFIAPTCCPVAPERMPLVMQIL